MISRPVVNKDASQNR